MVTGKIASRSFSRSLQVTKDNYQAHTNFGLALVEEGKIEEAIVHYNEAIRLSTDPVAYNNRGIAYNKLGKYQLAIQDYNETIRLEPDYANAYYNRGNVYAKELGNYDLAIKDYNEAIRLEQEYTYYNNRGIAYANIGQYGHAIEDFNEAIRLRPDSTEAYSSMGGTYLLQGNRELGCINVQKACALGDCRVLEAAKGQGYCR